MERSSGILLHISSLPAKYGVGDLGKEAYAFVDFLQQAGQKYWQILPLCPTGYGDSPYQGFSAFAGNPYFIDPEQLQKDGFLTEAELDALSCAQSCERVDYGRLFAEWPKLLKKAYNRFCLTENAEFDVFVEREKNWLADFALFMALKEHFGGKPWLEWDEAIRMREERALEQYREQLKDAVRRHSFIQFVFDGQWKRLRAYAHDKGIGIIGDIPIYVPMDSADVWANPENFQLDEERRPSAVAGVPPDAFTEDGQLWGHPLYDWARMEKDGYDWWLRRIGKAAEAYDMIRIDHFRGLYNYWSVPATDETARGGKWVDGPAMKLIDAIRKAYPDTAFIAEDLGLLTEEVHEFERESGFAGMKVLEFAYDSNEKNAYLPHKYPENCVCYTGTHDNQTLLQWVRGLDAKTLAYIRKYLKLDPMDDLVEAIVYAGLRSKADLFVAQMQDYLRLGAEARMNEPGKQNGDNWRWRMRPNEATPSLAAHIRYASVDAGRV